MVCYWISSILKIIGYKSEGEILSRLEFWKRKTALWGSNDLNLKQFKLSSMGMLSFFENDQFINALAEREEMNREGRLMTIVFLRTLDSKGKFIVITIINYKDGKFPGISTLATV